MKGIVKISIGLWVVGLTFVFTLMHSWHYISFEVNEPGLALFVEHLQLNSSKSSIIHFLAPLCGCSEVVLNHLLSKKPRSGEFEEHVVLIDGKGYFEKELKQRGYKVFHVAHQEFSKDFSDILSAVPMLMILGKNKVLQYAGAYSEKTITPFTKIDINRFIQQRTIASIPIKGCTVSKKYQKLLDPMGLKYERSN